MRKPTPEELAALPDATAEYIHQLEQMVEKQNGAIARAFAFLPKDNLPEWAEDVRNELLYE